VAHKTALKAKAMVSRRHVKEREAGAARGRDVTEDTWEPLLEILDRELNALPEKYRAPIVLCDLEGLSYREAAARLKCPQGTLSGRLLRARVRPNHLTPASARHEGPNRTSSTESGASAPPVPRVETKRRLRRPTKCPPR